MAYIEDRIKVLEDRVSTLEDIIETDGEKLDTLGDRFCKLYEEVTGKPAMMPIQMPTQVQQTTEEFVRVVHCKDCKNYHKLGADFGGCDEWGEIYIKEDDYCSRGIKK